MVTHVVLLKVKKSTTKEAVKAVFESIGALRAKIPGITSYAWGPYSSPEGMNRGFTHGFTMGFNDAKSRDVYLPHPEHEKVKAVVLSILEGGVDGVLAFDFVA